MGNFLRNTLLVIGTAYLAGSAFDAAMYDVYQKEQQRKVLSTYQGVKSPTVRQSFTEWVANEYITNIYGNIETVNLAEGETTRSDLETKIKKTTVSVTENSGKKAIAGVCMSGIAGLFLLIRRLTKQPLH